MNFRHTILDNCDRYRENMYLTYWVKAIKLGIVCACFFLITGCGIDFYSIPKSNDIYSSDSFELDRFTWAACSSGTTKDLYAITFGNSTFVALGEGGTIAASPDGTNWTTYTHDSIGIINVNVTYGNNQFVIVGSQGTILTSPDGINWTSRSRDTAIYLFSIVYGNNIFVAAERGNSRYNDGVILTSSDGITWTKHYLNSNINIYGLAYVNNMFIGVGGTSILIYGRILTSPDGTSWSDQSMTNVTYFNDVTSGNNIIVAVGEVTTDGTGGIVTSSDGTNWALPLSGTVAPLSGICFGNNTFVAVGQGYQYSRVLTSKDGIAWTSRTLYTTKGFGLNAVANGNNTFVAVGKRGTIFTGKEM